MNKQKLITMLIEMILRMLTPELLKTFADTILDFVEDKIISSDNTYDDRFILPICKLIRLTFDIDDNDDDFEPLKTYKPENNR